MKKLLAASLACCMMFFTIAPAFASADTATYSNSEYLLSEDLDIRKMSEAELTDLAAAVFPEYADEIRSDEHVSADAVAPANISSPVVYTETRDIGDTITATIVKLYNGLIRVLFTSTSILSSVHNGSGYSSRMCDIYVTCNIGGEFLLIEDFQYAFMPSGATISSRGVLNDDFLFSAYYLDYKEYEDSSGPAYATYQGVFTISFTVNVGGVDQEYLYLQPLVLTVEVGNNAFSLDIFLDEEDLQI